MTKTQEHKIIIWALLAVAVAIIIWLLMHEQSAAPATTSSNPLTGSTPQAPGVAQIPGGNTINYGVPATGLPNTYSVGTPPAAIAASNGDCSCGCDGSDSGSITYNFGGYNAAETNTFDALQYTSDAVQALSLQGILNSLGYNEGVAVSNATPTPWAPPG